MPTPKAGYALVSGEPVPGTTTILGRFDDKSALMFWAFEKGKTVGLAGEHNARLYDKKEEADIGSHVHAMVLEDLHGRPLPAFPQEFTDEMVVMAQAAFHNYKRELRRSKAFFMPVETQLVSEKYRYGGTPDAVVQFEDVVDGADWKTSKSVFLSHLLQGSAYRQLWNENHPTTPMVGFRIYRFAKESGAFAEHYYGPETLDLAFKQFVLFREAWDYDKRLKKLV